ncbi:hypothetical protein LINPERPRIM_LOCUS31741 [Linum perenne]
MREFREAMEDFQLVDILMIGYPYTWSCSRGKPEAVEEILDRCLVTDEWLAAFPYS